MKSLGMAYGAATLATCVLVALTPSGHAARLNPMLHSTAGAADETDPLCEAANRLVDWICGTTTSAGIDQLTDGSIAEVDFVTWGLLEPLIAGAKAELDTISDLFGTPNLDRVDAGTDAVPINTSFKTTEQMGDDLCDRARAARDRICNSVDPDHQYGETLWDQMRWLLDELEEQARPW